MLLILWTVLLQTVGEYLLKEQEIARRSTTEFLSSSTPGKSILYVGVLFLCYSRL